jgi:hypothetical protein
MVIARVYTKGDYSLYWFFKNMKSSLGIGFEIKNFGG